MQMDMHYYGTYAIARAAGFNAKAAHVIAFSAQFVDDCCQKKEVAFEDGCSITLMLTAHKVFSLKNLNKVDQLTVWAPFHFLPGCRGEEYTEKLICREGSETLKKMLDFTLSESTKSYGLHLVGLMAHVFMDTFSHSGFSGASSRWNKIVNNSILLKNVSSGHSDQSILLETELAHAPNIKSWLAETATGAVGHSAVGTCPDIPYLNWEFQWERADRLESRDNVSIFHRAADQLHSFLVDVAKNADKSNIDNISKRDFNDISNDIMDVIRKRASLNDRIQAWIDFTSNHFGKGECPKYMEDDWNSKFFVMNGQKSSVKAKASDLYMFLQGARSYFNHLTTNVLPVHDVLVC